MPIPPGLTPVPPPGLTSNVALGAEQNLARIESGQDLPGQQGSLSRYLQGAGLPSSIEEAQALAQYYGGGPFHERMLHQIMLPFQMVGGAAGMAGTKAGEHLAQREQAVNALKQGDLGGYVKHGVASSIPVVGPTFAEGNIAGGLGELTALFTGTKGLRMGTKPRVPKVSVTTMEPPGLLRRGLAHAAAPAGAAAGAATLGPPGAVLGTVGGQIVGERLKAPRAIKHMVPFEETPSAPSPTGYTGTDFPLNKPTAGPLPVSEPPAASTPLRTGQDRMQPAPEGAFALAEKQPIRPKKVSKRLSEKIDSTPKGQERTLLEGPPSETGITATIQPKPKGKITPPKGVSPEEGAAVLRDWKKFRDEAKPKGKKKVPKQSESLAATSPRFEHVSIEPGIDPEHPHLSRKFLDATSTKPPLDPNQIEYWRIAGERPKAHEPQIFVQKFTNDPNVSLAEASVARPEEVALLRDIVARAAERNPNVSRLARRIEVLDEPLENWAMQVQPDKPGVVEVNISTVRADIAASGPAVADAELEHELVHLSQGYLGKLQPWHQPELEPPAYARANRLLGYEAWPGRPLTPKELKHGPEPWRGKPDIRLGEPPPHKPR